MILFSIVFLIYKSILLLKRINFTIIIFFDWINLRSNPTIFCVLLECKFVRQAKNGNTSLLIALNMQIPFHFDRKLSGYLNCQIFKVYFQTELAFKRGVPGGRHIGQFFPKKTKQCKLLKIGLFTFILYLALLGTIIGIILWISK